MSNTPDPLHVSYTKHLYDVISERRRIEYESRLKLIDNLLKSAGTSSILIASGWIVLVTSSKSIPLTMDILFAAGIHVFVVGLAVSTTFAIILSHTSSLCSFEDLETILRGLYSRTLLAHGMGPEHLSAAIEDIQQRHQNIGNEMNTVTGKFDPKTSRLNTASWTLGTLTVVIFIFSLFLDLYVGYVIVESSNEANRPAPSRVRLEHHHIQFVCNPLFSQASPSPLKIER